MRYCEEFAALLDPYIDNELSPEETARVREHLRTCDGCRAYVQAALLMRDAFPEAEDAVVPEGFAEGVMAAIRADAAPRKRPRSRWQRTLLPLAACFAVVVLAVSTLPRSGDTAVRNDETTQAESQLPESASVSAADSGAEDSAADAAQAEEDTAATNAPATDDASASETQPASSGVQEGAEVPSADTRTTSLPETSSSEATESAAAPVPYAVQTLPCLTLTEQEAGTLLERFTPVSDEDGTLIYELTAAEYADLLEQLEQQGMTVAGAAAVQEAEAAGTVRVCVIPS
ncbi:anti-sigma factor family protein [Oscillibacter valericigenes]|uniref:anti-sigma factor family protein n=1 Tax=Oscillibacter valericigenes TaxID=351091 RepID=UPI00195633BF|nr:zf-HC2 domain-containing protein [Oscillibacter valericigenes]MBM6910620.1 zf-HC2 domain-containing protein [Oscillibacter valericigenes]